MNKKEIMFIFIATFIAAIIWVTADILHTRPSEPINSKLEEASQPIDPTFDQATLDRISSISAAPVATPVATALPITLPTATPLPSPTPLPTLLPFLPSPTASSSGTLPSPTP